MAITIPNFSFFYIFITISIFLSSILYQTTATDKPLMTFYWHDTINVTAITIINPVYNSKTHFGEVRMIDNPLTEGPDLASKELGRAQGLYAQASLDNIKLLMMMNFIFTAGKYNGSTITIMGSNAIFDTPVRELAVLGGTGLFRFARGYAQINTTAFNPKTGDAVVKYDLYVMHY